MYRAGAAETWVEPYVTIGKQNQIQMILAECPRAHTQPRQLLPIYPLLCPNPRTSLRIGNIINDAARFDAQEIVTNPHRENWGMGRR